MHRIFASFRWVVLGFLSFVAVTAFALPRITVQPSPLTNSVSLGAGLTNRITATSTNPPLFIQWRRDGIELVGQTNAALALTNIQLVDAGSYMALATDSYGSVTSQPWVIEVDLTFIKVTDSPLLVPGSSRGSAFGDWNRDGWLDLFVATGNSHYLFSNRHDGTFTRVISPAMSGNGNGAAWGDYDNDGFLDLLVPGNSVLLLYHNNGDGTFTRVTTNAIAQLSGSVWTASWADYDRDGRLDVFVTSGFTRRINHLFHNDGHGAFTQVTNNILGRDNAEFSNGASWGDFDDDGWPDLFVANARDASNGNAFRPNFLYRNLRVGQFEKITNSPVNFGSGTGGMAQGAWGDYDNDGRLDLFVSGFATTTTGPQRHILYHNDGGSFSAATNAGSISTDVSHAQGAGWADYDNDGWLDLLVSGGGLSLFKDFLYRNNGNGTFTRITSGSIANDNGEGAGCVWGDVNNDGFPDLYVANFQGQTPEKNAFYLNAGNSNAWLTLRLEGRLSNRSGVGAKVRLKAVIGGQTRWQLREISGSSGYLSQHGMDASFGMGDATNAELVRIEWPSGIVQELRDVVARQILTVIEPEAHITPVALGVQAGEPATFTVRSTLEPPVEFQWKFNDVLMAGETNVVLNIANVLASHAGIYSVSVTQLATGLSFDTPPARLFGPVVITSHPQRTLVRLGSNATLSVTATGVGQLRFEWQLNGVTVSGATNSTLTLTNVGLQHEGHYTALVSNSFGTVTSSNAELILLIRPTITLPPSSQSIVAGGSVTLSGAAQGHPLPLSFRWLKSGSLFTNIDVNGTEGFLTLTNLQPTATTNRFYYRLTVTNLAGNSLTSPNAIITVLPDGDGDGLPDEWETQFGLNATNAADGALDADGDGASNTEEYASGTNPTDATETLRIDTIERGGLNDRRLRFIAKSNRTYSVQQRQDLGLGAGWSNVAEVAAAPTNRALEIRMPASGEKRYFRIVTPREP